MDDIGVDPKYRAREILARNPFIKPARCRLLLNPRLISYLFYSEDRKYKDSKVKWWENVYGFDYSLMKDVVVLEPLVDTCNANQMVAKSVKFQEFDLYTVCT